MTDLGAVRQASAAITAAHLFIRLAPEAAGEATAFGVTDRQAVYFAFRSAALGTVPWQVTLEWRGDAHFLVLAGHHLGASDCNVIHAAAGRLPTPLVRATRGFTDEQWSAATARLVARGWLNPDGTVTHAGTKAREQIETETDKRCAALWAPIGAAGARRLASLITPINQAFTAAGTYELLRSQPTTPVAAE